MELPSIQTIIEKMAMIQLPEDGVHLSSDHINKIEYEDDKLILDLKIVRTRSKTFQDFQKELLKLLKIEMGVQKVALEFAQEEVVETATFGTVEESFPKSKFIAIASGKGGVGKSTVTVELAKALHAIGKKVAIIDADVYGASIPKIMNVLRTEPTIDGMKVKPFLQDGIEIISSSLLIAENKPVMWKGPMLGKLVHQFFTDVAWNPELDFFLIDMPPGTGDIMFELKNLVPSTEILLVTTPQEDAAYVAIKAGQAAIELEHPLIGVIENMSYVECQKCNEKNYVFGRGGGYYVAEALGSKCIAEIPINTQIDPKFFDPVLEVLK